jgi:DNA (cytosine-5)-methyltransferase 1
MDLGFDSAGWTCAWQVEINPYARRVLEKHWPGVRRHDDVRTFPGHGDWTVDAIIGGDPCQANTIAAGPSPSRSESLGGEFIRVVDAIRPRIVVRENPTHVKTNAPWPWWRFRSELESLG